MYVSYYTGLWILDYLQSGKNTFLKYSTPETQWFSQKKLHMKKAEFVSLFTQWMWLDFLFFSSFLSSRVFVISVLSLFVCLLSIYIPQVNELSFILIESFKNAFSPTFYCS